MSAGVSGQHTYEVSDLRALEAALKTLKTECETVQAMAMGAAGVANAQWGGPSNFEFMAVTQLWNSTAAGLISYAESLAGWAGAAASQYEAAQQAAATTWGGGGGGGGGPAATAV